MVNMGASSATGFNTGPTTTGVYGNGMSPWGAQNNYVNSLYGAGQYGAMLPAQNNILGQVVAGSTNEAHGPWDYLNQAGGSSIGAQNPATGPWASQINSLTDIYNRASGTPANANSPPSHEQYMKDIGMFGQMQSSVPEPPPTPADPGVVGGGQVTPNSTLPAQETSQIAAPYNAAINMLGNNPSSYGNLMKGMRGNRMGAMMSQYGMPRMGGNPWGTMGQGALTGANPALGAWGAQMAGPWGAIQGGMMGGAGGYFGGQY